MLRCAGGARHFLSGKPRPNGLYTTALRGFAAQEPGPGRENLQSPVTPVSKFGGTRRNLDEALRRSFVWMIYFSCVTRCSPE